MYSLLNLKRSFLSALVLTGALAAGPRSNAVGTLARSGSEYSFLPSLPGDQLLAQLSFNSNGGYLVVQDNSIDGNGIGIRFRHYSPDFSALPATYAANSFISGDQMNPVVAALPAGGGAFAWESSSSQGHRVFVRFLGADDRFLGREVMASASAAGNQAFPSIAALTDGTVVVAWSEDNREPLTGNSDSDGYRMQGIFAQRFTSAGVRLGDVFQVNQVTTADQRLPIVTALPNGNFVVGYISDEVRYTESIDFYARIYSAQGEPIGSEFRLNSSDKMCANPALVALPNGFRAAWSGRTHALNADAGVVEGTSLSTNGWDAITRIFDLNGKGIGDELVVNNTTTGDQYSPKLATAGDKQLIVWTSFGQDGADEGIYGRLVDSANNFIGDEFLVNTRTISKQRYAAVAPMGSGGFAVVWSTFMGGAASYDLSGQNYTFETVPDLAAPSAPFASSLSQNSVCLTWNQQFAQQVDRYLVYVDDETTAEETADAMLTVTRLSWQPSSTHTFRLAYRTVDGKISAPSDPVSVKTWGADSNNDGLPDDWQSENWGKHWPAANDDTDNDGATNLEEFLAGTDPTDPASVLRLKIESREQGIYVEWNTQAGSFYQLQVTSDFKTWRNVSTPRFAPSTSDSLPAIDAGQVQYYRVIRMR
jgi:hypothetical protein